jgi:hypothetical protein
VDTAAAHRPADEIVKEIEAALATAAEPGFGYAGAGELRLMRNVKDLSALATSGKRLFIVAEVDHSLHLRMFDLEGKMVLDSDARRFTSTWADYLRQAVPTLWPPHELAEIEKISIINAIRSLAGRSVPDEMRQVHDRIATFVGELRTVYPNDPRVAHYLPERWASLTMFGQGDVVVPEIREILETTRDPELRASALYFEMTLRFREPLDASTAVSLAESFAAQAPGDKRAAELLQQAVFRLSADWYILVRIAVVFAMVAGLLAATIGMGRWLKYAVRMGAVLLAVFAVALAGSFFLAHDTLIATIRYAYEKISGGSPMVRSLWLSVIGLDHRPLQEIRVLAGTLGAVFAVTLAALSAVCVVVARRRFVEPRARWPSAIRLGAVVFFAVLAACCGVNACLIGIKINAIRERIVRDYPGFHCKLIQGERRQRDRFEGPPLENVVVDTHRFSPGDPHSTGAAVDSGAGAPLFRGSWARHVGVDRRLVRDGARGRRGDPDDLIAGHGIGALNSHGVRVIQAHPRGGAERAVPIAPDDCERCAEDRARAGRGRGGGHGVDTRSGTADALEMRC